MAAGIQFEGVAKRFGNVEAVRDLNLSVEAGTRLALLGPSGCGKTTALRMLAGIEVPDAGRILISEKPVNDPRPLVPPSGRGIGMVFQSLALWPHMTVEKNLLFAMRGARDAEKARRLLALVGLEEKVRAYPHELSGGQQQRVALARALVTEPDVLLMDEPMANLDEGLKRDLLKAIRSVQEEFRVTTVYVTHDQHEAFAVAEVLAVMRDGRIEQEGPPLEVYRKPASAFVARFLGRANVLAGAVKDGQFLSVAGSFPVESGIDAEDAAASLRAEDLEVREDPEGPLVVKACAFEGGHYVVEMEADAASLVAESREPFEPGARVSARALRPAARLPGPRA